MRCAQSFFKTRKCHIHMYFFALFPSLLHTKDQHQIKKKLSAENRARSHSDSQESWTQNISQSARTKYFILFREHFSLWHFLDWFSWRIGCCNDAHTHWIRMSFFKNYFNGFLHGELMIATKCPDGFCFEHFHSEIYLFLSHVCNKRLNEVNIVFYCAFN